MNRHPALVAALLAALLPLAGCGTATVARGTDEPAVPDHDAPPPVEISYEGGSASLAPWTYCYVNVCADGAPPEELPSVGSPSEVQVSYPLDGWTFTAEFTPAGDDCGRSQTVDLEPGPDGTWVLRPAGFAGTYDVTLSGMKPGEGDAYTTFRWKTPGHGPLPEPTASTSVLADHDGEVDSYGVELSLTNLATTPESAEAEIVVTAEDGSRATLQPRRQQGCLPEGTVYWSLREKAARDAAALGGETFGYRVTVRLDGTEHVATASWPDDTDPDYAPSVPLDFAPPLPALSPRR